MAVFLARVCRFLSAPPPCPLGCEAGGVGVQGGKAGGTRGVAEGADGCRGSAGGVGEGQPMAAHSMEVQLGEGSLGEQLRSLGEQLGGPGEQLGGCGERLSGWEEHLQAGRQGMQSDLPGIGWAAVTDAHGDKKPVQQIGTAHAAFLQHQVGPKHFLLSTEHMMYRVLLISADLAQCTFTLAGGQQFKFLGPMPWAVFISMLEPCFPRAGRLKSRA